MPRPRVSPLYAQCSLTYFLRLCHTSAGSPSSVPRSTYWSGGADKIFGDVLFVCLNPSSCERLTDIYIDDTDRSRMQLLMQFLLHIIWLLI